MTAAIAGVGDPARIAREREVEALSRGAATLSREDNRIAALALLWAAVAIDPQNFVAHRRLAAALTNSGDVDAAADEYARFIELALKDADLHRAACELAYARAFLGDMPQLRAVAAHPVPLSEIATALDSSTPSRSSEPLQLADHATSRAPSRYSNGGPRTAPPTVTAADGARGRGRRHRQRWYERWSSASGMAEYVLLASVAAATAVMVVFGINALR